MRYRAIVLGFVLSCLLPINARSQESQPKFSSRIKIDVSADDKIKGEVSSYLSRELRSLGDVVLTDINPELKIGIVVLELTVGTGRRTGYVFSVVVSRPLTPADIERITSAYPTPEGKKFMADYYSTKGEILNHFALSGGDDLPLMSKKVVASIDSDTIESERKSWQVLQDYLKKNPQLKRVNPN